MGKWHGLVLALVCVAALAAAFVRVLLVGLDDPIPPLLLGAIGAVVLLTWPDEDRHPADED